MAWIKVYTPPQEGRGQHSVWLDESAVEAVRIEHDYTEYVSDSTPTPIPYSALERELLPSGTLTIRFTTNDAVRWMTDEQAMEANR